MKYCFILNPAAGKGTAIDELDAKIQRTCTEKELNFEIYRTVGVGDAREYVTRTVAQNENEAYHFYACGGDGTICEVMNGIMDLEHPERVALGVIPSGTGNDFVRNFTNNEYFLDIEAQLGAREREIDLLRANDLYCINMINIGFDCEVVCKTAEIKRKRFVPSKMAYIFSLVATLIKKPGMKAKISLEGSEPTDVHYLLSTYANGAFCGGGFHSNPKSSLNDGKIDTIFVNNLSRLRFISIVGAYKSGTHLAKKYEKLIKNGKYDSIDLFFDAPTNVSIDGEIVTVSELHISLVRNALRILIPEGSRMIGSWSGHTAVPVEELQTQA